jgi:DNA-binding MarR family transcriptional regulator
MTSAPTPADLGPALRDLLQAGRQMQAAMAARLGLRLTDLQAIDHVVSTPEPIGPVELGQRLGMRSASATVLVDRLVAAGHLVRRPHPADGRRITLAATAHARHEIRAVLAPLLPDLTAIGARLGRRDLAVVLAVLGEISAVLKDYE